jgi:LysR family transcriptional regulator, cys regulon transcriptional activator
VAELLRAGEVDIGIATEALAHHDDLAAMPCYRWTHSVVVPIGHELAEGALTLERLSRHPLITYDAGFTGRAHIDAAFTAAGLAPQIALTAMDADVIKTYVELGLGVGIVASIAYDDERDRALHALDARHLFAINTTRLAIRRGAYLRSYVYAFIEAFAPTLTREVVEKAVAAG